MTWLAVGVVVLAAGVLAVQAFVHVNPRTLVRFFRYLVVALLFVVSLPIAYRGGVGVALALIAGALMIIGVRPLRSLLGAGARGPSSGQVSEIDTDTLHVTLDHDSGEMDGLVRRGPFAGRRLSGMAIDQLMELLRTGRTQDPDAAALLETYLARHRAKEYASADPSPSSSPATRTSPMSRDEALAVLGLEPGASREAIVAAHRALMKKLHPDHGGSSYLASKINQAKARLLGE